MSDLADKHIDEYADHVDPDAYEDPEHYEEGHGDDAGDADDADGLDDDPELAALKKQMEEMEKEAQRLRELQEKMTAEAEAEKSEEAAADDVDARSIYVGNVDYASTPEGLQEHFKGSGTINRVTILCDKFTGHPKGYAYVEFATTDAVTKAQILDGSMFHGRPLKVNPKRTNVPGMNRGRGRGRGRGGYMPRGRGYGGYRGRGRGAYYSPY